MDKFNRTLRGYDPDEVNQFLDQVISKVENMIAELKEKDRQIALRDEKIAQLTKMVNSTGHMRDKLAQYERIEATLNRAIVMAQKTSDQIKSNAHKESEIILEDAKKNASRIVNESLLKAEKTEMEANMLRRNVSIYKRKLKNIIEAQLELVDDIEKVEL
ncbi:MAG: DivIVA domain-containing protein [Bacilli bacterium]|nr:DivIVA domain-containing protein [Bacilli bacterium]